MTASLPPPYTPPATLLSQLRGHGYAVLSPAAMAALCQVAPAQLQALAASWDALPPDAYLRDGGHYRHRRHACYVLENGALAPVPHRAHWQPLEYNALHGGMQRWFEPVAADVAGHPAWQRTIVALGAVFSQLRDAPRWHVEAHQFRIDTAQGIGRPTPEGAHRDGVDFVAVCLVARVGIKGGETRVFDADGPAGQRFTLEHPGSLLLLDDTRVIHESTPIQPLHAEQPGHRDTLVLTYRAAGFQGGD